MKKSHLITLIVAFIFILAGGFFMGMSFGNNGFFAESESSTASSKNIATQSLEDSKNLTEPYSGGFPANPSAYPPEKYGKPITTGDFGLALSILNAGIQDKGQEVYAYRTPDNKFVDVRYSPSDKAISNKDAQTIAIEYMAMAKMIIDSYPNYSDVPTETVGIYLGNSTVVVSAAYVGDTPITSLLAYTGDSELDLKLKLAYDVTFADSDISNLF